MKIFFGFTVLPLNLFCKKNISKVLGIEVRRQASVQCHTCHHVPCPVLFNSHSLQTSGKIKSIAERFYLGKEIYGAMFYRQYMKEFRRGRSLYIRKRTESRDVIQTSNQRVGNKINDVRNVESSDVIHFSVGIKTYCTRVQHCLNMK